MDDLRTLIDDKSVLALRGAYSSTAMRAAMTGKLHLAYPPMHPWTEGTEATFYATDHIADRDRERCLIALLTVTGPPLSMAIHIYWGLMEGIDMPEICHVIALAACYGGVPKLAPAFAVLQRLGPLLADLAARDAEPTDVLDALAEDFR